MSRDEVSDGDGDGRCWQQLLTTGLIADIIVGLLCAIPAGRVCPSIRF